MNKEQWDNWYTGFYNSLPPIGRILLEQSKELKDALARENYSLAEEIVREMFPDSIWGKIPNQDGTDLT